MGTGCRVWSSSCFVLDRPRVTLGVLPGPSFGFLSLEKRSGASASGPACGPALAGGHSRGHPAKSPATTVEPRPPRWGGFGQRRARALRGASASLGSSLSVALQWFPPRPRVGSLGRSSGSHAPRPLRGCRPVRSPPPPLSSLSAAAPPGYQRPGDGAGQLRPVSGAGLSAAAERGQGALEKAGSGACGPRGCSGLARGIRSFSRPERWSHPLGGRWAPSLHLSKFGVLACSLGLIRNSKPR